MTRDEEIADLDERIRSLRAASRPSEPLEDATGSVYVETVDGKTLAYAPTAQGHILSALSKLERRRELLRVK